MFSFCVGMILTTSRPLLIEVVVLSMTVVDVLTKVDLVVIIGMTC